MALAKAAFLLIAITCCVKAVSFVEKQFIAYFFGLGDYVDAWFVAVSVPLTLFLVTRELLEPAYLPVFMRRLHGADPRRAWQVFTVAAGLIAVMSMATALIVYLTADTIAAALGPG